MRLSGARFGAQAREKFAIVVGEVGFGEQVGAVCEGLGESGLASPAADGGVVAAGEDLGDGNAAEVGGAGVVWVVEQAAGAVGGAGDAVGGDVRRSGCRRAGPKLS